MAESLHILSSTATKSERYATLLPQLESLCAAETDVVANLANCMAALKEAFGFFWVGVYRVQGNELVLGPFQGPLACTRIAFGKGVCGAAWKEARTIVVPDVDAFPGHIACSSLSKSEIVVPVFIDGTVHMVLDVDSAELNTFDETDAKYLEEVAALLTRVITA